MSKLNTRFVATAQNGLHADGNNLYLNVNAARNSKSWIFRYSINGKRREMGIGSAALISLSEARNIAHDCRKLLKSGIDPLEHKRKTKQDAANLNATKISFKIAAAKYIASHESGWTNSKHSAQWKNTLKDHAFPVIGDKDVADITLQDVLTVLTPIWISKTETATRVRSRIQKILDWSIALGYRTGDNPARSELVTTQIPAPSKIKKVTHHKALPYIRLNEFISKIQGKQCIASFALEFLINTASRTSEVTGATWDEIDIDGKTWIVPAERMKMRKEHRVPLNSRCIEILNLLKEISDESNFIFPGRDKSYHISDMTMSRHMKRLGFSETVHGFRSSFKDWAVEQTNHPNIVSEQALAHVVGGVEGAYRRGDLLAKRAILMEEWCCYLKTKQAKADVTTLQNRNAA
jgi:integrase